MQKIMFDHRRFGLEQAVLERKKTMTRRAVRLPDGLTTRLIWNPLMGIDDKGRVYFTVDCIDSKQRDLYPKYQVGEVVAIGQAYGSFLKMYSEPQAEYGGDYNNMHWPASVCRAVNNHIGWSNKMYVRAELMPHRVRITNIKLERMQDISDEDCAKDGIVKLFTNVADHETVSYIYKGIRLVDVLAFKEPRAAFRSLITKMMGNNVWDDNPWVWVYEFELVK